MSEKFKEDIRNTIQQTVREELSKVLPSNKDTGECSSSETSQSMPTTSTTSATRNSETSCQSRGQSFNVKFSSVFERLVDKRILNQRKRRNVEMRHQFRGRSQNNQRKLKSKSLWHMLLMVSLKYDEIRLTY